MCLIQCINYCFFSLIVKFTNNVEVKLVSTEICVCAPINVNLLNRDAEIVFGVNLTFT